MANWIFDFAAFIGIIKGWSEHLEDDDDDKVEETFEENCNFDVVSPQDEEIQRNYLQNLKNLILTENPNKTQDIKPNQYSMDEIYNRFKKTQRPITIKDLDFYYFSIVF